MAALPAQEIKVFYCYAREDQGLRDELEKHLINLKRIYRLQTWFDRQIMPGEHWEDAIDEHLNAADLILLLISPDFMASDYCYNKEMARALTRHASNEARVIPVLLRRVHWKGAPFSSIQMLPTDVLPIVRWADRDEAFYDVVVGIERAIKDLMAVRAAKELSPAKSSTNPHLPPASGKTKEEWLEEGNKRQANKYYEDALLAYQQALSLDPNYAPAYRSKGNTLNELERYNEAISAFEQAIRLNPEDDIAYHNMGRALYELNRYDEALQAYEQAIRFDPNYAPSYNGKGNALWYLKQYAEALLA